MGNPAASPKKGRFSGLADECPAKPSTLFCPNVPKTVPAAVEHSHYGMRGVVLAPLLLLGYISRRVEGFLVLTASTNAPAGSRVSSGRAAASMASAPKKAKPSNDEAVPVALVEHAVAWTATNGLGMVVNDDKGLFTSTHLPFSLLPYGETT